MMKEVLRIKTPDGEGAVQYGTFMPNDGRKRKYHCWWNGCGIGGQSHSLGESKKHLTKFIVKRLTQKINELEEKAADLRIYLRTLS